MREGQEISLTGVCAGEGSLRVDLGLTGADGNFSLDLDCSGDRGGPEGFVGPAQATAAAFPEIDITGDVRWALRVEEGRTSW
ncbi:hypothetical protein GCM10022221_29260 [Actinocorallia aurea]